MSFTVLLLLSSKMRSHILAASLILLASFISANDQINQILANAKEINEKGWDDDLHLCDIDKTTMTTTTTTSTPTTTTITTMTTMTNKKNKTITINDLTRAVKTVKEAIEESGLSPGEISGIAISLLTFLVTCGLGCLKLMAYLRTGGTVQEFLAGVLEAALIRLRRRQRLGQEAVEEAAPSSAFNPDCMVGRETEV